MSDMVSLLVPDSLTRPLPLERVLRPDQPLEIEIGCGNGRFLVSQAQANPDVFYLGIERMLSRVRKFDRKVARLELNNIRVLRLEAFYTFYYLLPRHRVRTVYVFFPDPWPKRRHHTRRLFGRLFLDALWSRLEIGGAIHVATDHHEYFVEIERAFEGDARFQRIPAMRRAEHERTDFEMLFRKQGVLINACGFKTIAAPERALAPLSIPEDEEPRAGVQRREVDSRNNFASSP